MISIKKQVKLSSYTTFKIGGEAKYLVEAKSIDDLIEAVKLAKDEGEPILVIGGGSNLLISDNGFSGLVIVNKLMGISEIREKNNEEAIVSSKSGETWDDLVKYSTRRNYWGLENLAYIPGTVGASPVQNIGAYGREIKDTFLSLEALSLDNLTLSNFSLKECNFSYRSSVFKEKLKDKYIITSVSFKLSLLPRPVLDYGSLKDEINKSLVKLTAEDVRLVVERIRKEKLPDPDKLGNAGSFFKNPEVNKKKYMDLKDKFPDLKYYEISSDIFKIPAAWLIDKAGWKGKSLGLAGIWHKQALIMINNGGASFNDIKFLSKTIVCEVKHKFDIELIPEVNIID